MSAVAGDVAYDSRQRGFVATKTKVVEVAKHLNGCGASRQKELLRDCLGVGRRLLRSSNDESTRMDSSDRSTWCACVHILRCERAARTGPFAANRVSLPRIHEGR